MEATPRQCDSFRPDYHITSVPKQMKIEIIKKTIISVTVEHSHLQFARIITPYFPGFLNTFHLRCQKTDLRRTGRN